MKERGGERLHEIPGARGEIKSSTERERDGERKRGIERAKERESKREKGRETGV